MQDTDTDPQQQDLDDASAPRPTDELRVLRKTSTTLTAIVIGPKGLTLEVSIVDVAYDGLEGAALRAIAFEKALIQHGLKVPEPVAVRQPAPLPQSASQTQQDNGGPIEIAGVDGKPPRCSIHGPMKWMEGTSKSNGNHYEFWACTQRDCRPAKARS